jgi:hypothetical protein
MRFFWRDVDWRSAENRFPEDARGSLGQAGDDHFL